jgi:hypothetical protein
VVSTTVPERDGEGRADGAVSGRFDVEKERGIDVEKERHVDMEAHAKVGARWRWA